MLQAWITLPGAHGFVEWVVACRPAKEFDIFSGGNSLMASSSCGSSLTGSKSSFWTSRLVRWLRTSNVLMLLERITEKSRRTGFARPGGKRSRMPPRPRTLRVPLTVPVGCNRRVAGADQTVQVDALTGASWRMAWRMKGRGGSRWRSRIDRRRVRSLLLPARSAKAGKGRHCAGRRFPEFGPTRSRAPCPRLAG
jgi:hypothetical protein